MVTPEQARLRLREWRERRHISQREAGILLATHTAHGRAVSQGGWASWETGAKKPDLYFAFALESLTKGAIKARHWIGEPRRKASRAA